MSAVDNVLDQLDDKAAVWAHDVNLDAISQTLAREANPESIEAMLREAFVEGYYRGVTA